MQMVVVFFHAIKSDIVCEECPKFDTNCEILWSSVNFQNSKKLYLASYYRPPNSSSEALDEPQKSIDCVFDSTNHHPNIILGGDFNLGDINWKSESPELWNQEVKSIPYTISNFFRHLTTSPLHNTSPYLLVQLLTKPWTYYCLYSLIMYLMFRPYQE